MRYHVVYALGCALSLATLLPIGARAEQNGATASPAAQPSAGEQSSAAAQPDCTIVDAEQAGTLLGTDVEDADAISRKGGICSFTSRALSTDGNVSYAVVTAAEVARRRPYFRLLDRRCGGVHPGAPNAFACAMYDALAQAQTVDAYYAARTAGAKPIDHLGDAAAATGAALYVRRGATVIEVSVRREDSFDLDRSKTLARMLLTRLPPQLKTPSRRRRNDRATGSQAELIRYAFGARLGTVGRASCAHSIQEPS